MNRAGTGNKKANRAGRKTDETDNYCPTKMDETGNYFPTKTA